ncbi:MAG TPA: alpha-amylase family glycosyl hydrolase [Dehalococcoidia bacterium]|nr:alpha-amylase family glycosyl hydrolase [Dehalococcoidia bacterium]
MTSHQLPGGEYLWWKHGVVYQIYPRSFQDSDGDGIGDLQGVIDRLDYLNDGTERSLGIDAIWFSPTYPSPMADFGYDVSDYCGVHADFGDLATMDRLIGEAHKRGIRVILDFVPNHTSSQHPWFLESRASADSPKRDWYVWRDAKPDGSPPNNWIGAFGGSAWEWDQRTLQYYLHSFLVEQPDLNWRNPEVAEAMHNVLRFWMDRGVDGFRIDVMDRIIKDPELRDNPPQTDMRYVRMFGQTAHQLHTQDQNWPEIIDAVREIRKVVDAYPERMTVGEVFGPPENIVRYYGGEALDGLHLAFNFPFVRIYDGRWSAENVRRHVDAFEAALPAGGWPNYVFGNHDVDRLISRVNGDGRGPERARVAALLLLTLRGTPFVYYGEEIGMENGVIPEEMLRDPARRYGRGRDPERTPMQWTGAGGFTAGTPWLPYSNLARNVEDELEDPRSLLTLYRRLIWLRRGSDALRFGDYAPVDGLPAGVYAYTRTHGDERLLVLLNFTNDAIAFELPAELRMAEFVVGTHDEPGDAQRGTLAANEGRLLRLG